MFNNFTTMTIYTAQYWNERDAQWKPCGVSSADMDVVRARQFQMIRDCGGTVRFRIIQTQAA